MALFISNIVNREKKILNMIARVFVSLVIILEYGLKESKVTFIADHKLEILCTSKPFVLRFCMFLP